MGRFIHMPYFFALLFAVLFLALSAFFLRKGPIFSFLLAATVLFCGFLNYRYSQCLSANHISNFTKTQKQLVYVKGGVVSTPEPYRTRYGNSGKTFDLKANALKKSEHWHSVQGLIRATVYGQAQADFGDELLIKGTLRRPYSLRNPGGFDYREFLANHNIFAVLSAKGEDVLRLSSCDRANNVIFAAIAHFKQSLRKTISENLDEQKGGLLSAILLGERRLLSQDIKDMFVNTGTVHILAISGLHIGLAAVLLVAFFSFLRLPRNIVYALVILLLIAYAILSGARPSVVRATIMAVIVLLGFLIHREVNIYNSLGLAALLILIYRPQYLFDAGFQLSFLSVVSIVYFAPTIENAFSASNRLLCYLIKAFSVSLSAWIGVAPLVAFYFNIVSPVAILANLIVIPLLFLSVAIGSSFLFFASLWPSMGIILARLSWISLHILIVTVKLFVKIPFAYFYYPSPGILAFFVYYGGLLSVIKHRRLKLSQGKILIIILLVINFFVWSPQFAREDGRMRVTFFDVGHGDAIFIEFPNSGTMLIDGGRGGEDEAGRWVILPFLHNKGIDRIDALVLTHADDDHVGGLASVLKNTKVGYVFDNGLPKASHSYENYKKALEEHAPRYHRVKRGDAISGFANVKIVFLHPSGHFLKETGADANNNSLVLKLEYKDIAFLFCADVQREGIKRLLALGEILESDVIKVPHHGSDEGIEEERLFESVAPKAAVISAESGGPSGFASTQVEQRLKHVGSEVYKTWRHGAIIISTEGDRLNVETMITDFHGDSNAD
ncbi:MAG: DNA internalization-related competence protein ComEC/Rec2 [Candidatus Omnitrophica bacterium]|nr:DNA internalization-related competence protein ComEC/Rec2 [Candidatus Omnitrophota bacterium]